MSRVLDPLSTECLIMLRSSLPLAAELSTPTRQNNWPSTSLPKAQGKQQQQQQDHRHHHHKQQQPQPQHHHYRAQNARSHEQQHTTVKLHVHLDLYPWEKRWMVLLPL